MSDWKWDTYPEFEDRVLKQNVEMRLSARLEYGTGMRMVNKDTGAVIAAIQCENPDVKVREQHEVTFNSGSGGPAVLEIGRLMDGVDNRTISDMMLQPLRQSAPS